MEPSFPRAWHPLGSLHREIDRLFNDFGPGFRWPPGRSFFAGQPLFRREMTWPAMPAVDLVESENAYRITADVPGLDEKNIEVKMARRYDHRKGREAGIIRSITDPDQGLRPLKTSDGPG
jgi:HSP20 family protein